MKFSKHSITKRSEQTGAVLLISLIMLLLLTIIGVSSVEDMTLQSNMTRNSQFKMQAFNTAYSETVAQYQQLSGNISPLTLAMASINAIAFDPASLFMPSASNPFKQTVSLNFEGSKGAHVADTEAGMMELSGYEDMAFELNSTAKLQNTGSQSDQLQGLNYTAPKN